jgi:protein-S-isoprenylcysteine O-methyltransferase Ste14
LGIPLLIAGLCLVMRTWWVMKAAGTTLKPGETSAALVTSGPFRFSRNPMYLGALAAVVGESVLTGALVAFIFPVVYFVATDRFVASHEEVALAEQFGDSYREYRRHVRRWL